MNPFCQFKKDDKLVTITDNGKDWNYKKEFGSNIIECFDTDTYKLADLYIELLSLGYNMILKPDESFKHFLPNYGWHILKQEGPSLKIKTNSGDIFYHKDNKLHRENGPAINIRNGNVYYYIEGNRLSEEEFNQKYGKTNV